VLGRGCWLAAEPSFTGMANVGRANVGDDLAGRGMVQRSPDPADRRRNIITITPAGTRQLRQLNGALAGVQDKLPAPLTPAERQQLTRLLAQILEHHEDQ
jgi:MarR family transcriptional regulator, lower aerobic nicotinate degradation pathway regulator